MNRKYYTFGELMKEIPDIGTFTENIDVDYIEDIIGSIDVWADKNGLSLFHIFTSNHVTKFIFNVVEKECPEWSPGSFGLYGHGYSSVFDKFPLGTSGPSGDIGPSGTSGVMGTYMTSAYSSPTQSVALTSSDVSNKVGVVEQKINPFNVRSSLLK